MHGLWTEEGSAASPLIHLSDFTFAPHVPGRQLLSHLLKSVGKELDQKWKVAEIKHP